MSDPTTDGPNVSANKTFNGWLLGIGTEFKVLEEVLLRLELNGVFSTNKEASVPILNGVHSVKARPTTGEGKLAVIIPIG